ncbi:uncharacterized protein [Amphiura filiformis]|uniref:uncharacterized protein n=1 Tax=Amphiura filiformis TaxID=82378 RepID=UPI003B22211C
MQDLDDSDPILINLKLTGELPGDMGFKKMKEHGEYAEAWVILATAFLLERDIMVVSSKETSSRTGPTSVLFKIECRNPGHLEPFRIGHLVEGEHYIPLDSEVPTSTVPVTSTATIHLPPQPTYASVLTSMTPDSSCCTKSLTSAVKVPTTLSFTTDKSSTASADDAPTARTSTPAPVDTPTTTMASSHLTMLTSQPIRPPVLTSSLTPDPSCTKALTSAAEVPATLSDSTVTTSESSTASVVDAPIALTATPAPATSSTTMATVSSHLTSQSRHPSELTSSLSRDPSCSTTSLISDTETHSPATLSPTTDESSIASAGSASPQESVDIEVSTPNASHDTPVSSLSFNDAEPVVHDDIYNDIGTIINATMTNQDVKNAINALPSAKKYALLRDHVIPESEFKFPTVYINGCNRSFNHDWLTKYKWLVYSKTLDGGFCKYCALFAKKREKLGVLVNKPFTRWTKVSKVLGGHGENKYHIDAYRDAKIFQRSNEHPEEHIDVCLNKELIQKIEENRHIVKCAAECILFCGKQCIGLRGDKEKRDQQGNPGNFLAALKLLANHDVVLKRHLNKPRLRNALYVSPQIQNELIDIIGQEFIQKSILKEVRDAKYFAIMVDEVTSHNKEMMPLCVRFVDSSKTIREEFLHFSQLTRVTGKAIADRIKSDLLRLDLDISNIGLFQIKHAPPL